MAQGDSKLVAEYDYQSGLGTYNNSTDTFAWLLVTNTYASLDANTVLNAASVTGATVGGNYAGKTALSSVTWARSSAVTTLDAANVTFAANASNPTDACCMVIMNDTATNDPLLKIIDLTTDGSTPVDLTQGFTITFNASGLYTVTANA